MKSFSATILTEGSGDKGFGHITRCSALYDAIQTSGNRATLVIDGTDEVRSALSGLPATLGDWIHDSDFRASMLSDADCVIIDSYHAPLELYQELVDKVRLVICIDDYGRVPYPPQSVVLKMEWQANTGPHPIKVVHGHNLPATWYEVLLRKEFTNTPTYEVRQQISIVMVSFGATDLRSFTPQVVTTLTGLYPDWRINVIIGPGFRNENKEATMDAAIGNGNISIIEKATASDMKQFMLKSDLAITAAGQTLNELARIGVPTIATIVADNQELHAQTWNKRGFIQYIDGRKGYSKTLTTELHKKIESVTPKNIRKKMSDAGQKIIDGHGAMRIVRQIKETI